MEDVLFDITAAGAHKHVSLQCAGNGAADGDDRKGGHPLQPECAVQCRRRRQPPLRQLRWVPLLQTLVVLPSNLDLAVGGACDRATLKEL